MLQNGKSSVAQPGSFSARNNQTPESEINFTKSDTTNICLFNGKMVMRHIIQKRNFLFQTFDIIFVRDCNSKERKETYSAKL